jgi:periplasmic protein TonB
MPRDLFGTAQGDTTHAGSRSRVTVVLSLAAHAAAIPAIIAATVLGPVVLPGLASTEIVYHMVSVPPPPPPPVPRAVSDEPRLPARNPNAAPTEAPDGITTEPDVPFDTGLATDLGPGVVPGLTSIETVVGDPPLSLPPVGQQPVVVGGKVRPPTKVRDVSPVYPPIAQAARVQGMVIIETLIGVDGHVQSARVLRSIPLLDAAAIAAVTQWAYTPTLLNGTPVPVIMTVTVRFELQ